MILNNYIGEDFEIIKKSLTELDQVSINNLDINDKEKIEDEEIAAQLEKLTA